MDKPRSGVGKATDNEDVEIIRKMADRYEDGEIAREQAEPEDGKGPVLEPNARRKCKDEARNGKRASLL